jgi:4a-hydroxytetrahydrobiopterin dehydratase
MPYAPLLSEAEIEAGLAERREWRRESDNLVRTVECPTFRAAIDLVDAVAEAAEAADHHPDIDIRWRRVTFRLTTKAADGITFRDLAMAATIDDLVSGRTTGLESPGS